MTVLLDAYAVIALLRDEPSSTVIRPLLVDGIAMIHPLNLGEVIDKVVRLGGVDGDEVEADVAMLGIERVDVAGELLIDAGHWRARHYHRVERAVSLADCVAAVHAIRFGMDLATADPHLAALVRTEGGQVLALPDSKGRTP